MKNSTITKELNAILKGEFMAIDFYEEYMKKIDDENIKSKLQEIQQDHKHHSLLLSDRIVDLGGHPAHGVGLGGKMAELMNNVKHMKKSTIASYLEEAKQGEDKGIAMSREVVRGDLDKKSMNLVQDILDTDDKHVDTLDSMLDAINNIH